MKPWADQQGEPQQQGLELVEDLLAQVEAAETAGDRASLLCKVAEVYERRLGDSANALVSLQAAFKEDPGSGRVVQEMERLARGSGKWADVVASTAEVADSLPDPKQAADLWVQIAFWNDTGLGELADAADAARAALALNPEHGGALALLEDLYRRLRRWDEYVEILSRKWSNPYRDHYKIAESYEQVLRYEPQHRGALAGLAGVQEEAGQWAGAVETLRRLATVVPEADRTELHYRVGAILLEKVGDVRAAEEQLVQALALAPNQIHVASMLALEAIYTERGDFLKARQMLGRAAEAVTDPEDKVQLLFAAAEICQQHLDDDTQAAELYAAVLSLDPAHAGAVEPLAAIWFRRGNWDALLPLAERLVADPATENRPPAERARLHHQLGRAAAETGNEERAAEAYRAAVQADATYLPALRDFGALAFRRETWAEAATVYGALLAVPPAAFGRDPLRRDETLEALERQGLALLRSGDAAGAVPPLDRALALDPRRRVTLEALAEATTATGDHEAVIRHTQALLTMTDAGEAKLPLYLRLAETHRHRRNDPQKAIAAYFAALEVKPDERPVMLELVDLLTATKQWKQAVQVLTRLAELDTGHARARTLVAAGNILHYELHAEPEAIDAFDQALDADPDDLSIFERIDKVLTEARDWKTQERCYRRQIKRMGSDVAPDKRPALLALWQGLGEIHRSRLKDYPSAIAAYEVAAAMVAESPDQRAETGKILAELYQLAGPPTYGKAINEHRLAIHRLREGRELAPHLKLLLRLFVELGQLDHAFCTAQSLVLVGQADGDERALFEQYRPRMPLRARSRMTEELWQRCLCHPDQDRLLSGILAAVSPAVGVARAKPHKDWSLKRKQRRDVASDPATFCRALAYTSGILGVPWPEVYLFPESPGEIDLANARETINAVPSSIPAFVVGRNALEGRSEMELAFIVGRNLAMMRPDAFVRWPTVVPTIAELEVVVRAAIALVVPDAPTPPPEHAAAVAQYREFLIKVLAPQLVEQLSHVCRRFLATGIVLDVARWSRGVALTAIRAGLLISGDLEVAAQLGEPHAAAAGIDAAALIRDLAEWNVSDEYFTLREQLGLAAVNLDAALR